MSDVANMSRTYRVGESLLKTRWCLLLDLSGDCGVTGGVGLALSVLVGGRHSDGVADDRCCSNNGSCESAELEYCRRHDEWIGLIDNDEVLFMYGRAGVGASL